MVVAHTVLGAAETENKKCTVGFKVLGGPLLMIMKNVNIIKT